MSIDVTVNISVQGILSERGLGPHGRLQKKLDSEIIRRCDPYTPRDNGVLIKSVESNTDIGSGRIIWSTPYAKRWYYETAKFQGAPTRGNHWFERMWNENKDAILQTLAREVGGKRE